MQDKSANVSTPGLIFACSGAADVGAIADAAARNMAKQGMGQLLCLAAIGAHIESYVQKAKNAPAIVVVDGCGMDCGRKSLEHLGVPSFKHIRITDLGLEKGKSPLTEAAVETVVSNARKIMS
jgi:uncharacterized metal-binding protein